MSSIDLSLSFDNIKNRGNHTFFQVILVHFHFCEISLAFPNPSPVSLIFVSPLQGHTGMPKMADSMRNVTQLERDSHYFEGHRKCLLIK